MTPEEIAARLTPAQKRALLWIANNEHWRARVIPEPPYAPPVAMLLGGATRKRIAADDWRALRDLVAPSRDRRRVFDLTPLGLAVRAVLEARDGR